MPQGMDHQCNKFIFLYNNIYYYYMKRKSPKSGKGIIDTYNKFKDIGTKLIYGRKDLSPKVQKVLSEYGNEIIVGATVARKPVTSIIQSII